MYETARSAYEWKMYPIPLISLFLWIQTLSVCTAAQQQWAKWQGQGISEPFKITLIPSVRLIFFLFLFRKEENTVQAIEEVKEEGEKQVKEEENSIDRKREIIVGM